ncbi:AAA family ATPase [Roseibacterium sp. SDUM158016]|uniref:nSTAND1 domain-containing NTPase n=1 Tax=Roseicyclus sediminis TaxID=2980997 RepID=UPI0021D38BA0|nr:AAA family ATPase [Roseibacterium sp. SDUM158016]MCU4653065.1 AAA family ATPase [Roseibacterium sp. SDUM158016]
MVYRVFLSSPDDVAPERQAFRRVVDRINLDRAAEDRLEAVLWEESFYRADSTFQAQIPQASACDIVVCVLWRSLGSELPPHYARADGTIPTGTEYEFETALESALSSDVRVPDVFVFRKKADVTMPVAEMEERARQFGMLERFWTRWFRNEQGHFVTAFNWFDDTGDFETRIEAALRAWLVERDGDADWQGSPFRGLDAFGPEDAPVFFGRRDETDRARARFLANAKRGHRALFILGPSGSGKSSLLRAGLLPRLQKTGGTVDLPRLDRWVARTPSALAADGGPALGLARALFDAEAIGEELSRGDFATPEALSALFTAPGPARAAPLAAALGRAGRGGPEQGLILVLDQFEEVFQWSAPKREALAGLLKDLSAGAALFLVATMRSEFQHRLAESDALDELANGPAIKGPDAPVPSLVLRPPTQADIREMIRGPARKAGLAHEGPDGERPDLATRIEAEAGPDTLPALQLLLSGLWDAREGNVLTHAAYDALGGVGGVMATRGDAALAALSASDRAAFPALVRLLVDMRGRESPVVARRLPHQDLPPDSALERVANALRDARLLVADDHGLRLAHESLIRGWGELDRVVEEEARRFALRSYLAAMAERHRDAARTSRRAGRETLLRGLPLREARDLQRNWGDAALEAAAPDLPGFIRRSVAARRLRAIWQAGTAAAVVAALGFGGLFVQRVGLQGTVQDGLAALESGDVAAALDAAERALRRNEGVASLSLAAAVLRDFGGGGRVGGRPDVIALAAPRPGTGPAPVTLSSGGLLSDGSGGTRLWPEGDPALPVAGLETLGGGSLLVVTRDGRAGRVPSPGGGLADIAWAELQRAAFIRPSQWSVAALSDRSLAALADGGPDAGLLLDCPDDSTSCEVMPALPPGSIATALSADGARIAWATFSGTVGQGRTGDAAEEATGTDMNAAGLAFLGDGSLAVAMSDGGIAHLGSDGVEAAPRFRRTLAEALPALPLAASDDGTALAFRCGGEVVCAGEPDGPFSLFYPVPRDLADLSWDAAGASVYGVMFGGGALRWQMRADTGFGLPLSFGAAMTALARDPDRWAGLAAGDAEGRVHFLLPGARDGARSIAADSAPILHLAISGPEEAAAVTATNRVVRIGASGEISACTAPDTLQRVATATPGSGGTLYATSARAIYRHAPEGACPRVALLPGGDGATLGGIAVAGDGTVIVSRSDGALLAVAPGSDAFVPAIPPDQSRDTASALSLDIHPAGRWIATSRSDGRVLILDLARDAGPVALDAAERETRTVAFSPDGRHLAVLGATGAIDIVAFDADGAEATAVLRLDTGLPRALLAGGTAREVAWIAWTGPDELAVATAAGDVVSLPVTGAAIARDLSALRTALAADL